MITSFEELKVGQRFHNKERYGIGFDECCYDTIYEIVSIHADTRRVKVRALSCIATVWYGEKSNIDYPVNPKPIWCRMVENFYKDYLINRSQDICIRLIDEVSIDD